MRNGLIATVSLLALAGCDLAPDLVMPKVETPAAFKEEPSAPQTVTVEPATDGKWKRFDDRAQIMEVAWWRMFNDTTLDELMEKAMRDNPSLESAMARVASARATAGIREADLYPAVGIGFGPERTKQSPAAQEPNLPPNVAPNVKPYTLYKASGTISYELDLFGANRNRVAAAEADAKAEENNYHAARLSLQAELAQTYYRLIALRSEEMLLAQTVETRQDELVITKQKVDAGVSDTLVFSSAEAELARIQGEYASVREARAKAEHALAVLIGIPPSELKVDLTALSKTPPSVPVGMPSTLLERRPDVKRAAAQIAAANARIGVARTGYFPDISLALTGGFVSGELEDLFKWSNRSWMIGPLAGTILTQPIFEGGRIAAQRAQSDANYAQAVGDYKSAVLQAFREVEDQLSGLQSAAERRKNAETAAAAATRAHDAAQARVEAGYSSHLEFLDAERQRLAAERTKIQVQGEQYITTIQLIRALGGSWDAPMLPESAGELPPVAPLPEDQKPAAAPAETPAPPAPEVKTEEPAAAPAPEAQTSSPEPATEAPAAEQPAAPSAPTDPLVSPMPRTDGTI